MHLHHNTGFILMLLLPALSL